MSISQSKVIEIPSDSDEATIVVNTRKRRMRKRTTDQRRSATRQFRRRRGVVQDVFEGYPSETDNDRDLDFDASNLTQSSASAPVTSDTDDRNATDCLLSHDDASESESDDLANGRIVNPFSYEQMIPDLSSDRQQEVRATGADDLIANGKGDEAYHALEDVSLRQICAALSGYVSPTCERVAWLIEALELGKYSLERIRFMIDWGLPMRKIIHGRFHVVMTRSHPPLRKFLERLFGNVSTIDRFMEHLEGKGTTKLSRRNVTQTHTQIDGMLYAVQELSSIHTSTLPSPPW
ncbi:uncharacterized protein RHO25_002960 [Cercospora beticola]|uniref:BZIP domain-containing protein n=1 Tax=Cercospora beticola TaxID=122368 RepID=A0ABZ0NFN2_CERBT|nr:hypothetical protein RHO25_002960 [Cercospora beticola]CAK1359587.1 unnamed protein product [Cercospora beticola]